MKDLVTTSRVAATDLRLAERSINRATRDTAQFLMTALDATETHELSPAFAHRTVKATIGALASLALGQEQLAIHAHRHAEKAGRQVGLTASNWGEGVPKPSIESEQEVERQNW
jgi:hypothetical protein